MDVGNQSPKLNSYCYFNCANSGESCYGKLQRVRRAGSSFEFQDHRGRWFNRCESLTKFKHQLADMCA